jgi:hypothetical protein
MVTEQAARRPSLRRRRASAKLGSLQASTASGAPRSKSIFATVPVLGRWNAS